MLEEVNGWAAAAFTAIGYIIKTITDWLLSRQKQQATIKTESDKIIFNHWESLFKTAVERSDYLQVQVNTLVNQVNTLHLQHASCLSDNTKMKVKIEALEGRLSSCEFHMGNGKENPPKKT